MSVTTIIVPQINVNESTVFVVEWLAAAGSHVKAGEAIVGVETSKAVVEVEAEVDGYLRHGAEVGDELAVGATLGWIDSDANISVDNGAAVNKQKITATAKARQLADEHKIDLGGLGVRGVVTEKDVRRVIAKDDSGTTLADKSTTADLPGTVTPLNAAQKSALNVVSRSAHEQAATFMLGEADVTDTLLLLDGLSKEAGSITSYTLTDLLLHQTARTLREFPRLNSTLVAGGVAVHDAVHVGVTMEVAGQLYMAVLKDADKLSLAEISKQRMAILLDMMRGKGHDAISQRGTFSITVLDQPEVHHQVPIIYPDQAGIFGMGGVRREVKVGEEGEVEIRSVAGLCLSYDHRFINGHYGAKFLQVMSQRLGLPQWLSNV
ncbi:MAG: 2-oxo acid dehydrogenase subunit E2 [Magnetococcales bacterium]|nr:2-oxo acid dehydrogenase subunit E2 [Magnetococcales bacterium]